jgi:hypothetical protein
MVEIDKLPLPLYPEAAIVGDLHFGFKSGDVNFLDYQKSWLSEHLLPELQRRGIKVLIQTGDFFDIRKYMPLNVLDMVLNWLPEQLAKYGIEKLIVPAGNHDIFYRDSNSISSVDLLKTLNSNMLEVMICKDTVGSCYLGGKKFAFVPYLSKNVKDKLLDELFKMNDVTYVVAHLDVLDMPMMAGHLCEHGVDLDIFKQYQRVISGHFHIPSESKNLTYTGAPYHLNWGDVADGLPRGYHIINAVTNELEFIPNPDFLTLFAVIEYDPEAKYAEDSFKENEGNIVKVLVKSKADEKHYKKFTKILAETKFIDYKIIDTSTVDVEKVVISEEVLSLDTISALSSYIDLQGDDIDKDGLKRLANEIYLEALNA